MYPCLVTHPQLGERKAWSDVVPRSFALDNNTNHECGNDVALYRWLMYSFRKKASGYLAPSLEVKSSLSPEFTIANLDLHDKK